MRYVSGRSIHSNLHLNFREVGGRGAAMAWPTPAPPVGGPARLNWQSTGRRSKISKFPRAEIADPSLSSGKPLSFLLPAGSSLALTEAWVASFPAFRTDCKCKLE